MKFIASPYRPFATPSNIFTNPMFPGRESIFTPARWRRCPRGFARPVQFPGRNSLAVLTEAHLRPCVYAGLTLKCSHKLDPLATKSWKNLSVHMSPVYIIIVLAKRARIKRKNRASFLLARCGIANKSFSCYPAQVLEIANFVATILMLRSASRRIWNNILPKILFNVYSMFIIIIQKDIDLYIHIEPIALILKNF